jgi:hypothetical protein
LIWAKKKQAWGLLVWVYPEISVAKHFLLEFSALLGFKGQGGRGPGEQTPHPDGFAGFVAVAVVARVDQGNGLLDLLEQFALAVARAQL